MTIKTIVFDLGGVLINWDPRNLYRKIFSDHSEMEFFLSNICTNAWNAEQDRGRSFEEAVRMKQIEFPEYAKLIEMYHTRWEEMLDGSIERMVNILNAIYIKRKHRLYALTNWSAETFPKALELFDFLRLFEGILVSGKEKMIKPDEAIYHRLCSRFDIIPENALFIDDSLKNIEAAQKLGFKTIHFQNPKQFEGDLLEMKISNL